ncbi:hypothetical protein EYF80_013904 [Liparis tanakae]|uniref:Uncharacterized protein n=1 Tax=Liparis tanakae TaxID=230148 RepID=A0A4Z2IEQ8_9TELE|nr:hypothetical protein EYF80_013904 [Liparis tanakae]
MPFLVSVGEAEAKLNSSQLSDIFCFAFSSSSAGRPARSISCTDTHRHTTDSTSSDSEHGGATDSQNQPGIRQQEINHHGDAILSSPTTALEVHRFLSLRTNTGSDTRIGLNWKRQPKQSALSLKKDTDTMGRAKMCSGSTCDTMQPPGW